MEQHTTFSEAYRVLQDHMEESVITEGVLQDWPAYYVQVFQQTRQTRQDVQALEKRKSMEEALSKIKSCLKQTNYRSSSDKHTSKCNKQFQA